MTTFHRSFSLFQPRQIAPLLIYMLGIIFAVSLLASTADARDYPPRPDGPVADSANMLSAGTEAALDAKLREYNKRTGRAIIVATVPNLGGENIEPYATGLFENWGIGGAERDQGLLLLISKEDRKMRIEVGYGLHPYFGGIMAGRVIQGTITPRFKAGDFDGGVTAGVDAIIAHLDKSPEDAIAIEEAAQAAQANKAKQGGFPVGTIIWLAFVIFFFILPVIRGGRGRRRYRRGGGMGNAVGNIILWEAGKAIARGFDDDGGGFGGSFGGFGGGGGSSGGGFSGGGGFGGFGGGMSGGGGASGGW